MRIFITIVALMLTSVVFGQDPHFSQYYAAPLYLNPAFAGTSNDHRIIANYRMQWPSLPQAYSTYAASYDFFKPDLKSGFGVLFSTDRSGGASLRSTHAGLSYSFKIQMYGRWVLSPAVYFGYGGRSIDYNELTFGDQLEFSNSNVPTQDPVSSQIDNEHFFDSSMGLLFYSPNTWIGASWWHINRPNISFLNRTDRLPSKVSVHGGTRLQIYGGPWRQASISYFTAEQIQQW